MQREPYCQSGYPSTAPLRRYGIDCAGNTLPIDPELSRRLEPINDENALYVMSNKGDLLVSHQIGNRSLDELTVFHGTDVTQITPSEIVRSCPECKPPYLLIPHSWSKSWDCFMMEVGSTIARVYRTKDMQLLKEWKMEDSEDFPAHGFIDDHTAYQFNGEPR